MFSAAKKACFLGGLLALAWAWGTARPGGPSPAEKPKDAPFLLREIHREVAEMGGYPGEDFIRRDFSLGEDDDDTNKNHHVGVLIQSLEGDTIMTIQVTKLEPTRKDPRIRYGKEGRMIVCRIRPEEVEIKRSDFHGKELEAVLGEVLRAVLDKKKLLKR